MLEGWSWISLPLMFPFLSVCQKLSMIKLV